MREVLNKPMIIPCKPKEGSDISKVSRDWPVCNSLEFDRVHSDVSRFQDKSKVVHLSFSKSHFSGLRKRLLSCRCCKTCLTNSLCCSIILVAMRMLSI